MRWRGTTTSRLCSSTTCSPDGRYGRPPSPVPAPSVLRSFPAAQRAVPWGLCPGAVPWNCLGVAWGCRAGNPSPPRSGIIAHPRGPTPRPGQPPAAGLGSMVVRRCDSRPCRTSTRASTRARTRHRAQGMYAIAMGGGEGVVRHGWPAAERAPRTGRVVKRPDSLSIDESLF